MRTYLLVAAERAGQKTRNLQTRGLGNPLRGVPRAAELVIFKFIFVCDRPANDFVLLSVVRDERYYFLLINQENPCGSS